MGHRPDCRLVVRDGDSLLDGRRSRRSGALRLRGSGRGVGLRGAGARGRGVGRRLLGALIEESERQGIWTLQAGIFPENESSLRLHRAVGFRDVGRRAGSAAWAGTGAT